LFFIDFPLFDLISVKRNIYDLPARTNLSDEETNVKQKLKIFSNSLYLKSIFLFENIDLEQPFS